MGLFSYLTFNCPQRWLRLIENYRYIYIMKTPSPQFSIVKALEFVGDNSRYQKKQLLFLSILVLAFATLNCRIPLMASSLALGFLIFSGLGQFICPVYMSLRTISLGLLGSTAFTLVFYPVSANLFWVGLCTMGFFGRGLFVSTLVYLGEIGGDKFRSWSVIVILGLWGIAPLVLGLERLWKLSSDILWLIIFIFVPFMTGCYLVLTSWKPSALHLYTKRQFEEAKVVLNEMAEYNERPGLPYGLQGEQQKDNLAQYKKITYQDMISNAVMRKVTLPLLALWIYRQYIYYSCFIILPKLGEQITNNLILMSVGEVVAVIISYPIKLKIKRVNSFFFCTLLIAICSVLCSFTTLSQDCMKVGNSCVSKFLYRIGLMIIRFSIALLGSILINYTLQIYPADVRRTGFSLCLGMSSIGSTLMPWLVQVLLYFNLSGFIAFSLISILCLYSILYLQETNGEMQVKTLEEMESGSAMVSLQDWAKLRFI